MKNVTERIENKFVEHLHGQCRRNRALLMKAKKAACFHCSKIFNVKKIKKWVDLAGSTALCPHCEIDAVLPCLGQFPLETKFLDKMYEYYFEYSVSLSELKGRREERKRSLNEFVDRKPKELKRAKRK